MGIFTVISIIISIISFIIKNLPKNDNESSYTSYATDTVAGIFQETTLDGILICYETFKQPNFNIYQAQLDLRNSQNSDFKLLASDLQGDCLYLNVQFIDIFDKKSKNNETVSFANRVNTYFSINHLEGTDNVVIYGCTNYNQRIKDGYGTVAKEIRKVIFR
ncbi:hypothetical protein [Pedobacter miscanthi]|uniref:Uncharacterized protein n=1 Tax=Pedobacter miscanthi TaxID=2259170 RepID=A0A366L4G9_9SPHI|nr:hypothetical protein [Pedobacter miscanthi]RBQ08680.1 hypothetical protein DRW42_08205 [Pedobacter miscanthi]